MSSSENSAIWIKRWLWSGVILMSVMVVVGGITRLTGSGLSITEWAVIGGTIPPLNEAEWNEAFDAYKQIPQFKFVNPDMDLAGFKYIFFWEYIHRLIGRLIGLVFIIPFAVFLVKGWLSKRAVLILIGIMLGGALQGLAGWLMVHSGLTERLFVSHVRLAIHLNLAFQLIGVCVYYAINGLEKREAITSENPKFNRFRTFFYVFGVLLTVQFIWGAFTAGLHAGQFFNTWPLMNGAFVPATMWTSNSFLHDIAQNPVAVQWIHRTLGIILFLLAGHFFASRKKSGLSEQAQKAVLVLAMLVLVQFLLGIVTLLYKVPIVLGVAHQFTALLVWISWIAGLAKLRVR